MTASRYIVEGKFLKVLSDKYAHLSNHEIVNILPEVKGVFNLNFPLHEGAVAHMLISSIYLGVEQWRIMQIKDFLGLKDSAFMNVLAEAGWEIRIIPAEEKDRSAVSPYKAIVLTFPKYQIVITGVDFMETLFKAMNTLRDVETSFPDDEDS